MRLTKKIRKILLPHRRSKVYQIQFEGGIKRKERLLNDATESWFKEVQKLARSIDVRIGQEHRWSSSDICHANGEKAGLDGL